MVKRHRLLALILVFVMAISTVSFATPNEKGNSSNAPGKSGAAFDQKIVSNVDGDMLMEHVRVLSEDIGPRVAGTDQEWKAAEYIASTLKSYGYDAEIQKFVSRSTIQRTLQQITPNQLSFTPGSMSGSGTTSSEGITAELVYCKLGKPEEISEDIKGKIALIQRGEISFGEKAKNAADKGAVGVVIFNNATAAFTGTVSPSSKIPVVSLSGTQGNNLVATLEKGTVTVKLAVASIPTAYSPNVVATLPAKHKSANDQIVMFTAHLDSVANAPGANDNASGVAGLLELARILKSYQTTREVRFVACGAEEIGLVGSYSYVAGLSEEELSKIVAVYNMDMIGTSWREDESILIAWTSDGKRNIVTDTAVAAGARLSSAVLPSRTTRSDHHPFHLVGIPAAAFLRLPLEPYYHKPTDTIAMNISKDKLLESVKIVGAAAYELIRPDSPSLKNSKIGEVRRDIEENLDLIIEEHMEAYQGVYVPSI